MANRKRERHAQDVSEMFDRISRRYDLLNTVMTAGRHYKWRRMAVDMSLGDMEGPALDVATGTGDFALDLARRSSVSHVTGLDCTEAMLRIATRKTCRRGLGQRVSYLLCDAHTLAFPNDYFICTTVGFGVRNFANVNQSLREMVRVTRPSGRVVVLEIVRLDDETPVARLFPFYFRYITPWLGAILAGDKKAYTYLPESVRGFLNVTDLASMMEEAGLHRIIIRKLALGTVAIVAGEKRA